MPKRLAERTRISEEVVRYFLDALFEGKYRSGDRIDLDELAEELGVSRSPVREALVLLERDGIVATQYHRGVFVDQFDANWIVDFFEVYGHLSALAVARLANDRGPQVIARLRQSLRELRSIPDDRNDLVEVLVRDILKTEHEEGAPPYLRAQLRSFSGFVQAASGRNRQRMIRGQASVINAIAKGDAERAARARIEDFVATGEDVAAELVRRGVFDAAPEAETVASA